MHGHGPGLHYPFRLGYSAVTELIREACNVIWCKLETFLELAITEKERGIISAGFHRNPNFPRCIGVIGGKRIKVICPANCGSQTNKQTNKHKSRGP
jgi:hypothetical protein